MFKIKGSCHCENLRVTISLPRDPETYNLRACDCDFCTKHGAAYLSDPEGKLEFEIKDKNLIGEYQQGSKMADFILCKKCGVLVGVCYKTADHTFMGINGKIISGVKFKEMILVSPKKLSAEEKIKRWNEVWFKLPNKF